MNDYSPPFVIEQQEQEPFWDAYNETFSCLQFLGIELEYNKRIPIFQVYTKLLKMEPEGEVVQDDIDHGLYMLGILRDFCARGMEPQLDHGYYF